MDLIRIADLFIHKVVADYKDDVSLVVVMGSYIYNETHDKSDLDMFYIPKTQRGYNLGFTFIMNGIGFDYWPVSWERIERIAKCEEKITSIITEGKILYFASENDLERFMKVKRIALDASDKRLFMEKAKAKLYEAYKDYFRIINTKNLADTRKHAIGMLDDLTWALSLLNRTTIKRGRAKLKQEIMNMPLVPEDFSILYDKVFLEGDTDMVRDGCRRLLKNTEELLFSKLEIDSDTVLFSKALDGFYEEIINLYNKIYRACGLSDVSTALFASVELTHEIEQVFSGTGVSTKQLPDIVAAYDPENLSRLMSSARKHQSQFIDLLSAKGVNVREFNDFSGLEKYLDTI